jgi:hypothetical protein
LKILLSVFPLTELSSKKIPVFVLPLSDASQMGLR